MSNKPSSLRRPYSEWSDARRIGCPPYIIINENGRMWTDEKGPCLPRLRDMLWWFRAYRRRYPFLYRLKTLSAMSWKILTQGTRHRLNNMSETKAASRSRKPSQAPASISTKTFSPDGITSQSPEDFAKEWVEFCERYTP